MSDSTNASAATAPASPVAETTPVPSAASTNWNSIGRWTTAIAVGGAVLALELTGHAPNGTFLALVAAPVLATLGVHTAAKNLN